VTVNEAERDLLLRDFRAYSYQIHADEKRIASGPGIDFTLVPVRPGEPRTLVVDLSINRTMNKISAPKIRSRSRNK